MRIFLLRLVLSFCFNCEDISNSRDNISSRPGTQPTEPLIKMSLIRMWMKSLSYDMVYKDMKEWTRLGAVGSWNALSQVFIRKATCINTIKHRYWHYVYFYCFVQCECLVQTSFKHDKNVRMTWLKLGEDSRWPD